MTKFQLCGLTQTGPPEGPTPGFPTILYPWHLRRNSEFYKNIRIFYSITLEQYMPMQ